MARNTPIDISLPDIDLWDARTDLPKHFTRSNLRRIRSIHVGLAAYGGPGLLASLIAGRLHQLQTLTVVCRTPTEDEIYWNDREEKALHPSVSVEILGIRHAPALTRVSLRNCILPWTADIYSRLTHLDIRVSGPDTFIDERQCPTHDQLLSVITSMHAIEEFYLDIFPKYANAAVEQPLIHVPSGCQQITLHSPETHTNRHCYQLAASLVVPPRAAFIIKQAIGEDADLVLSHFAGPSCPPRALSLDLGPSYRIIGEVIIPFQPDSWLERPEGVIEEIPDGYICLQLESFASPDTQAEDDDARDFPLTYHQVMLETLTAIDLSEMRMLRLDALWEERDTLRLLGYDPGAGDVEELLENVRPLLEDANKLEVLIANLESWLEEFTVHIDDAPGSYPFPLLHTILYSDHNDYH